MCCFGWPGPAWGGWLGLRCVVVATLEERTRDYAIHDRRHERSCFQKEGPESPKPFPVQSQNPNWLFPRAPLAAAGVWAGIEPRSEWRAAIC